MTEISCAYADDRGQTIVAYLYDDIDAAERAAFSTHLLGCDRCRRDLAALNRVRGQLAAWSPPEPHVRDAQRAASPPAPIGPSRSGSVSWWREIPAWAQVAAALLFTGVSAGIANLDVRYDRDGLTVRTGWSRLGSAARPGAPPQSPSEAVAGGQPSRANAASFASRGDLTALERQLRAEMRAAPQGASAQSSRATDASDAGIVRRVRALVEESERRQQRELALRIAEVVRDVNAQRQADLSKIDRNLGLIQNTTGVEILKQREMVNYLMRVSQRQ